MLRFNSATLQTTIGKKLSAQLSSFASVVRPLRIIIGFCQTEFDKYPQYVFANPFLAATADPLITCAFDINIYLCVYISILI